MLCTTFSRNRRLPGNRIPCQRAIKQPPSQPAGWPNLDARRRSFRRRNVNCRPPCTWAPLKSRVSFHLQKCGRGVCHGIESFRSLRVNQRSETIECPSRPTSGHYAITCLDRLYVRTPRYWSLSVIDERHFSNDSPTCDFSILERGSIERRARTVRSKMFKRHWHRRNIREINNSKEIL